jgi:hypothetical protein
MKKHLLSIAAFLFVAITLPGAEKDDYSKSMYVPMCFDTKPKPSTRMNAVYVQTGPSTLAVPNDKNETLFSVTYMRRIKDDLSFGITVLGTDKRYLGTTFGFGYHF